MREILALAKKDLRILVGIKAGVFFTFIWPLLVAVMFGVVFSGSGEGGSKVRIAVADLDETAPSKDFIDRLEKGGKFEILRTTPEKAASLVRRGARTAAIVFPKGFGEAAGRVFYGPPPKIEVLIDPSRKAESAMIEGLLFQQASENMQKFFSDRSASKNMVRKALSDLNSSSDSGVQQKESIGRFLGDLDRLLQNEPQPQAGEAGSSWRPLEIEQKEIALERSGPHNTFDVTFPQGAIWGILGCAMTFGIGIVSERTHGTLDRLQCAPITRTQLLAGKALACFAGVAVVQTGLFAVGRLFFGVRPSSVGLLALACIAVSAAFVGLMMLVSCLGKTEQAAAGAGWAVMLPLSMLGGGMVPLFVMPRWMQSVSHISPIKWSILALEGAIWRGFTLREMLLPCAILTAFGIVCFVVGTRTFRTTS